MLVVASMMSFVLSSSNFPEKEAKIREENHISSDGM